MTSPYSPQPNFDPTWGGTVSTPAPPPPTVPADAPKRPWWGVAVLAAVVVAVAIGITVWRMGAELDESPVAHPGTSTSPAAAEAAAESAADSGTDPAADSRAQLEALEVKGRAPRNDYHRDHFGQKWSDDVEVEFGHSGCDTRNDILRRDLRDVDVKEGTNNCKVMAGVLTDPFSGNDIEFVRGQGTSEAVQIDHIVALSDAWQKGAQDWDEDTRRNFANDPRNLIAVDGPLNQQKSNGDAATWLPPNKAYRCDYARSIIEVKAAYGVWVTDAEKDALHRQLDTCPALSSDR